ncbi:MAG: histidine--tRNA ligase [Deltaproteobacteria bacterium]|nr:histidine--tRNA ligase [Deltaproteobacteria bacterium]
MRFSAIKGMHDVGPPEIKTWNFIEKIAREIFEQAAFFELRPPLLEEEALFQHAVGNTSDIVEKEMYAFEDRNGKRIALRPEGTASLVRAYIERFAGAGGQYSRFYYLGPMFRHERPQKGRFRQFTQIGAEVFGATSPYVDAEVIALANQLFKKLGLDSIRLQLNSLGCKDCRPVYRQELLKVLEPLREQLCAQCQDRLGRNPLRVLDCKNPSCQNLLQDIPKSLDSLCEPCVDHFNGVQKSLRDLNVAYEINDRLVRGLDYYVRTAFEFVSGDLGAQNAVAGGGRYDGLVENLGGAPTPAIGFALGMERLVSLLENQTLPFSNPKKIFIASLGQKAFQALYPFLFKLRDLGYWVHTDFEGRSLKAQLREANRWEVDWTLIAGELEIGRGLLQLKNMKESGENKEIPLESLLGFFEEMKRI